MASYEPDRDYGDENAYEAHRASTGDFCPRCKVNVQLPDGDFCGDCEADIKWALADEDAA